MAFNLPAATAGLAQAARSWVIGRAKPTEARRGDIDAKRVVAIFQTQLLWMNGGGHSGKAGQKKDAQSGFHVHIV